MALTIGCIETSCLSIFGKLYSFEVRFDFFHEYVFGFLGPAVSFCFDRFSRDVLTTYYFADWFIGYVVQNVPHFPIVLLPVLDSGGVAFVCW